MSGPLEDAWEGAKDAVDSGQEAASDAKAIGEEGRKLLNNPKGYILVTVATWAVSQFVLRPINAFLSMLEEAFIAIESAAFETYDSLIVGVTPAADALLAVPRTVLTAIEGALVQLGLGAPLAANTAAVLLLLLFWTIAIAIARVAADAIPGVGGLFR